MEIKNIYNHKRYNEVHLVKARAPRDSFILCVSDSYIERSMDIYNVNEDPNLLFQSKVCHRLYHTCFFDYNEKEKILPFISFETNDQTNTFFGVYIFGTEETIGKIINNNVTTPGSDIPLEIKKAFSVSPCQFLVIGKNKLLCFEYTTSPYSLNIETVSLPMDNVLDVFGTYEKNITLIFAVKYHKIVYNQTKRKIYKFTTICYFMFFNIQTYKYCDYKTDSIHIKDTCISYEVKNESIKGAIQDPLNLHNFFLIGTKNIHKINLDTIYNRKCELENDIEDLQLHLTYIEKDTVMSEKIQVLFPHLPEFNKRFLDFRIVNIINIDGDNFLIFSKNYDIICYTISTNKLKDIQTGYNDGEELSYSWATEIYHDAHIVSILAKSNNVFNAILTGHKDVNADHKTFTVKIHKFMDFTTVDKFQYIPALNKTMLSRRGNLYLIDEIVTGDKYITEYKLNPRVFLIERRVNKKKLYQVIVDIQNVGKEENYFNYKYNKISKSVGNFNLTITKEGGCYFIYLKNINDNAEYKKKIYIDNYERKCYMLTISDMFLFEGNLIVIDSDLSYYKGKFTESNEHINLTKLITIDNPFGYPDSETVIFSKFIKVDNEDLLHTLSTATVLYSILIKDYTVNTLAKFYFYKSFNNEESNIFQRKGVLTKLREDLLQINIEEKVLLLYKKHHGMGHTLLEIEGLYNQPKHINYISKIEQLTHLKEMDYELTFQYCSYLNIVYYYNEGIRMLELDNYKKEKIFISEDKLVENTDSDYKNNNLYCNFIKCDFINGTHTIVLGLLRDDFTERILEDNDFQTYHKTPCDDFREVVKHLRFSHGFMSVVYTQSATFYGTVIKDILFDDPVQDAIFTSQQRLILSIDNILVSYIITGDSFEDGQELGSFECCQGYYKLKKANNTLLAVDEVSETIGAFNIENNVEVASLCYNIGPYGKENIIHVNNRCLLFPYIAYDHTPFLCSYDLESGVNCLNHFHFKRLFMKKDKIFGISKTNDIYQIIINNK